MLLVDHDEIVAECAEYLGRMRRRRLDERANDGLPRREAAAERRKMRSDDVSGHGASSPAICAGCLRKADPGVALAEKPLQGGRRSAIAIRLRSTRWNFSAA